MDRPLVLFIIAVVIVALIGIAISFYRSQNQTPVSQTVNSSQTVPNNAPQRNQSATSSGIQNTVPNGNPNLPSPTIPIYLPSSESPTQSPITPSPTI